MMPIFLTNFLVNLGFFTKFSDIFNTTILKFQKYTLSWNFYTIYWNFYTISLNFMQYLEISKQYLEIKNKIIKTDGHKQLPYYFACDFIKQALELRK